MTTFTSIFELLPSMRTMCKRSASVAVAAAALHAAGNVALATPITTAPDANQNGQIDLQDLINDPNGFTVGDKHFSHFSYTPTGANAPTASQISVDIAPGTDYGLRFGFGWYSINGINMDSRIDYRVDVTDPNPAQKIDAVTLGYDGTSQGAAAALATEVIQSIGGTQLATLNVTPANPQQTVPILPNQRSILVDKAINLFSAPSANGTNNFSAISFVDNTYHQTLVPEPASFGILAAGGCLLLLRRRRRGNSNASL